MKRYFEGRVDNMRDIGGYETPYGPIPYGRFIRSNWLPSLAPQDSDFLRGLGVKTVFDLRTPDECAEYITFFDKQPDFKVLHFPFKTGAGVPPSTDAIAPTYLQMAEEFDNIKAIIQAFEQAPGGVVYYCFAGKDRTGVVTALLMLILGVSAEDIVSDYMLTRTFLAARLHEWSKLYDIEEELIFPQPRFMREFLDLLQAKYGNIDNYLRQMNLSAEPLRKKNFNIA